METKKWLLFPLLVIFMIIAIGVPAVVEARTCDSPSQRFKGMCVRHRNCASICQTEGFPHGTCHGFRRRCMCVKPCP